MPLGVERISRTYRHMGRYQHILSVLVRHGFGEILQRLEIDRYLEIGLKVLGASRPRAETLSRPARLRRVMEELGPTFIKLGQILSTRPDLVPLDFLRELEKLQDQASPFPGEEAQRIVEQELGRPVEDLFRSFDPDPLATASLGQVHLAELEDGRPVVVKVQRPGIRPQVETDLEILGHLAALAERGVEELEIQHPQEVVGEFKRLLEKELDYTTEAAHLRRFGRMFADDPTVRIPRVHRELTTIRVLTMERLDGIKASQLEGLRLRGYDLERIAERGATALLRQIFLFGCFHADPHPGNVMVLEGEVIGFIDLGQVGRLDRTTRYRVAALLKALADRNEARAVDALLGLTRSTEPPDRTAFEADVGELLDWYLDRQVGQMELGRMLFRLTEITNRQRRQIPPDLFLVLKALATVEGLSRSLAPSFSIDRCAGPVLQQVARERLSPLLLADDALSSGAEWWALVQQIPEGASEILQLLRHGKLHVEFEHKGLEPLLRTHEQVANRMVFAIVLAALLVASSLVALGRFPPLWHGIPILGLLGYLLSGILGLGLLISILRRSGL